jgi:hypothetical protein
MTLRLSTHISALMLQAFCGFLYTSQPHSCHVSRAFCTYLNVIAAVSLILFVLISLSLLLTAALYQPDLPANARYTLMCGTQQPRGYHGTATLTQEGKILVAGHDRPRWFYGMPNVPWFKDGTGGNYVSRSHVNDLVL